MSLVTTEGIRMELADLFSSKPVSREEVARLAGCSKSTIDRVMCRRQPRMNESTRDALLDTIVAIQEGEVEYDIAPKRLADRVCVNGHEWTPQNTRVVIRRGGRTERACRACDTDRSRAWRQRRTA